MCVGIRYLKQGSKIYVLFIFGIGNYKIFAFPFYPYVWRHVFDYLKYFSNLMYLLLLFELSYFEGFCEIEVA